MDDTEDEPNFATPAVVDGGPGDPVDGEPDEDAQGDQAWIEWHALQPSRRFGPSAPAGHEDDEEDDPSGQSNEDGVNTGGPPKFGWGGPDAAGCPISDPDGCQAGDDRVFSGALEHLTLQWDERGAGDPDDAEREQMLHDVPMLPVVTLDANLFNDQRQALGISNLQSSFRCGRTGVRSADSGNVFVPPGKLRARPGAPV